MATELIAVRARSGNELIETIRRAWDDGAAVLPIAPDAPDGLVARLLDVLRPAAYAQPHPRDVGLRVRRLPTPEPVPDGTGLVLLTSGSTGPPKGVLISHAAMAASVTASVRRLGLAQDDRLLCCLPTHHVAGLQVVLRAEHLGTEAVVHDAFDMERIAAATFSFVSLVPTQLRRLLDAGVDLSGVSVLLGGARVPVELRSRAEAAGARVTVSYGMTESCGGCVYDGRPLDGIEVDTDGPQGRIRIRGPVVMSGYHRDPRATAETLRDGWLWTNDRGSIANDLLEVHGRVDDVIVTGGENVSAEVVAAVLREHDDVVDAAVTSRPDPDWGELVVAVVVPSEPAAPPSLEELREHVRSRLTPPHMPRDLVLVDEVPRTSLGKPDRAALVRLVQP